VSDTRENSAPAPLVQTNELSSKPRSVGLTEVRGPYYSSFGPAYLDDLLRAAGAYVDWLKVPGPALQLLPREVLRDMVDICHAHDVEISAGGLIEKAVVQGPASVESLLDGLVELGFDVVEVSAGMIALSTDDYLRLVKRAKKTGMKVKAEVGVQFGAGGTSSDALLASEGTTSVAFAVQRGLAALEAGADLIVLESEGVTESVSSWRTDVVASFVESFGLDRLLFEAADPQVFEWYVKNFGPEVNLFVDHSQVLLLQSVRSGVWGSHSLWNRVATYKG